MKINKILFPTDFSEASGNALRYAVKLADTLEASLEVINIYRVPLASTDYASNGYYEEMLDLSKQASNKKLLYFTQNNAKGKDLNYKPIYGVFPVETIVEYANEGDFDLIVLGTKGERNALEKFMGSVTTDLMMKANCPVLAIPSNAVYTTLDSIAFATEMSDDSEGVIRAKAFADIIGAKYHLVHVEKRSAAPVGAGAEITEYPFGFTDFSLVEDESIEQGLNSFIVEKEVDILVMYIPKRKLWERIFHTSFTKKMTFHTHTPLLVLQEN